MEPFVLELTHNVELDYTNKNIFSSSHLVLLTETSTCKSHGPFNCVNSIQAKLENRKEKIDLHEHLRYVKVCLL